MLLFICISCWYCHLSYRISSQNCQYSSCDSSLLKYLEDVINIVSQYYRCFGTFLHELFFSHLLRHNRQYYILLHTLYKIEYGLQNITMKYEIWVLDTLCLSMVIKDTLCFVKSWIFADFRRFIVMVIIVIVTIITVTITSTRNINKYWYSTGS